MCGKLSSKLGRQLGELVSVAAGSLPGWCRRLPAACPWLFALERRERLTKCACIGVSHALWWLQVSGGSGSGEWGT